jgi:peroxiredoxin 2/4
MQCRSGVSRPLNAYEKFGVEVPFPIIEDLSMKVAHAYGMIQPGASDT